MAFSNQLFLLSLLLLSISSITHGADFIYQECLQNFTNNDVLPGNINSVILDLVTKTSANGYANSTYGSGNNTVYGIAECRGDITKEACSACIVAAGQQERTACTNSAESRIWYHQCHVHYSTTNFIGQPDTNQLGTWTSTGKAVDPVALKKGLKKLFVALAVAASNGQNLKFSLGELHESPNLNIYGMAQCTWDLQESACIQCLNEGLRLLFANSESDGSFVILKSCAVRHNAVSFISLNAGTNSNVTTSNITISHI